MQNGEQCCERKKGLEQVSKADCVFDGPVHCEFCLFCDELMGADSQRHIDHRDIHMDTEPDADDCLPVRFFVGV